MPDFGRSLPRERMDALNGWKPLRDPLPADGLLPEGDLLHLATAMGGEDGLIFAKPIPETEPDGSWGGRARPRGVAVSDVGDVYLADPEAGRVLYTRASLPPEPAPDSEVAPFVPLWGFPTDPGPEHPLNFAIPVGLCLIPADAAPGAFGDTLLVADAGRDLLIWVDRRQIVPRRVLRLAAAPQAVAVAPCGRVAVLLSGRVAVLLRGAVEITVSVAEDAHTVLGLRDGSFAVIGKGGVTRLLPGGRIVAMDDAPLAQVIAPAFVVVGEVLYLPGQCEHVDMLPFPEIPIDRLGRLMGTQLPLVTRPRSLPRPRFGQWISQHFDGEAKGFSWDRVALEAELPSQCRLVLYTYVSDILYAPDEMERMERWSGPTVLNPGTPTEFLIQRNKGRYFWLKIEAFGDGTSTPEIRGIDLFGPRDSQLNLLPAPFHQDPLAAEFLDRFLSLQDAFLGEVLMTFNTVGAILHPDATPEKFLDWLGSWFDWRFLSEWSNETRREMIAEAMQFFAERGTVCGLLRLLRWHTGLTGALPCILEDYRLAAGGAETVWIGGGALPLTGEGAHRFIVVVPHSAVPDDDARQTIERLIEAQKPAHTLARVVVVEPALIPGEQARLGVDAVLPDSRPPTLGEGRLDGGIQTVSDC